MLNFPGIYIYAFYPIPLLYNQIDHEFQVGNHKEIDFQL
jgi:hypothetical protein